MSRSVSSSSSTSNASTRVATVTAGTDTNGALFGQALINSVKTQHAIVNRPGNVALTATAHNDATTSFGAVIVRPQAAAAAAPKKNNKNTKRDADNEDNMDENE